MQEVLLHTLRPQERLQRAPEAWASVGLGDEGAAGPWLLKSGPWPGALAEPYPGEFWRQERRGESGFKATLAAVKTVSQATADLLCPPLFLADIQKLKTARSLHGARGQQTLKGQGNLSSDGTF